MKKIFLSFCLILLAPSIIYASDDTQVIDALKKDSSELTSSDLKMQSFESCKAFEDVMETYIKDYWETYYKGQRGGVWFGSDNIIMEDSSTSDMRSESATPADGMGGGTDDFSGTNIQVQGVEESDIAKTDGTYIYTFSEDKKAVYIIETQASGTLELIKKIILPETFWGVELYVQNQRLMVIASSYRDYWSRGYYIDRNNKSFAIVYDTSDISKPELIRLSSIEGNISQTRMIGDTLYMLTNNYFNIPYHTYENLDDIRINSKDILPEKLDLVKNNERTGLRSLILGGRELPYTLERGAITDCSSIMYHFPSKDTLSEVPFSPSYTIITAIDTRNTSAKNTTQVIAGSNTQIHMSLDNLYMTEGIYFSTPWSCPRGMACIMPRFGGGTQNTLIHKFNIDTMDLSYQDTGIVSGSPLTQYSMDEYQGNFRIITSEWSREPSTSLHILDKDLNVLSSLTDLAPGETFHGSRFIGDKLFLVTFELIDPLFVIDVSDARNPEVLGELKIPGYSNYLHPYDENHLIGLGYDTDINEWGGLEMRGVKLDLYKMHYDKKCGDTGLTEDMRQKCESGDYKGIIVEQLHSETFGGRGSSSEATYNPRMFIWNKNRDTLLLPINITDYDSNWRLQDFYNGALAVEINPQGITEIARTTHYDIDEEELEKERQKACEPFLQRDIEPVCRELINGEIVCEEPESIRRGNIPAYCYADSSVWTYIGQKSWEYHTKNIQRTLYIGDIVYTLSQERVRSHDWSLAEKQTLELR
ncbi:beta-propeller domain-containing protein [Candidatus Gracilibacteria bacterium]|nr:beta-propeller domain-containing protein [Candidatus Gracilibacteria bacterium]